MKHFIKTGDLVRFKISAIRRDHTLWLKNCAKNKTPMLVIKEYEFGEGPVEAELLGEKVFDVLCEDVDFHAYESELTKVGFNYNENR